MKCEKCENEAVFHYQSNINGEKTEYHLCADCAKAEGLGAMLEFRPNSMFDSFFRVPFGSLMGNMFREPFGLFSDSFFGRAPFAPTLTAPSVNISVGEGENATETTQNKTDNIPVDAGEEFRARRELHALKHQLRAAVHAEEYEKAAELRDKIRALEK